MAEGFADCALPACGIGLYSKDSIRSHMHCKSGRIQPQASPDPGAFAVDYLIVPAEPERLRTAVGTRRKKIAAESEAQSRPF
jgi:hypothetical protein